MRKGNGVVAHAERKGVSEDRYCGQHTGEEGRHSDGGERPEAAYPRRLTTCADHG